MTPVFPEASVSHMLMQNSEAERFPYSLTTIYNAGNGRDWACFHGILAAFADVLVNSMTFFEQNIMVLQKYSRATSSMHNAFGFKTCMQCCHLETKMYVAISKIQHNLVKT